MIPHIGPEIIAALLEREHAIAPDMQTNSAVEDSVSVLRTQSARNEKHVRGPLQSNVSWMLSSRLLAVIAKLTLFWLL